MRKISFAVLLILVASSENYGRGPRGGGGGGGFTRPVASAPQITSQPGGGFQSGQTSGSYTTQRGTTVDYKGAAVGGTTPGGVSGGRAVGGVQVTGPGGQTATKVGRGAAATGPGGNTIGGKSSVGKTTGPLGTAAGASRSGFAVGPGGIVTGSSGVRVGPGGGVAVGRSGTVATPHGTYHRSAVAVSGQGLHVRTACAPYHNCFTRNWYAQYPGAWVAAGWAATTAWRAATWSTVAATASYPEEPVNYDYGSTVVYQDNSVYINGEPTATAEEYAQQATTIADTGKKVEAAKDEEWVPLGVFAMMQGEETTSNNIFEFAINKNGVIRGNYYNALTDTTEPVFGSVDKKTQRAAWTVGDKKKPVYEAGIANLTQTETTMMAHYGKDRSQQFTLFRMEQPKDGEMPPKE